MACNHGNEYQVRIVHENGTEELSVWMNSEGQVAQAMAAVHRPKGKAYWLQERNVLCPDCPDREQKIVEYPLTDIPSPRCSPHDSRYLLAVGSRNQYNLPTEELGVWMNCEEEVAQAMAAVHRPQGKAYWPSTTKRSLAQLPR
jgi:hypothetical protein